MNRPVVGIQIGATTPPAEIGSVVAEAERLGYGEIWLAEDYFDLGGIGSVATALAATVEVPIGLGVVAAPARHPAVTAMEFATLGGTYPGRFKAGLGHGAPGWVRQMGLQPASPLGLLRETIEGIQQLLAGAEVTREGEYFQFDQIRLSHPPETPVPVFLGVHGPASLRLSGELADGTLLGWFSSPSYVAWTRERIDEGRGRSGREDPHDLVVLCVLSISEDDGETVRRDMGRWAGRMMVSMSGSPQVVNSTVGSELADLIERTEPDDVVVPDAMLSEFVAAGDPASCRATVDGLLAAGADRVVLVPNPAGFRSTEDMVEQIRIAAQLVDGNGSA
jgi:alkanesulfonate monooxygenase SsuD/methylene tetrahydromethanopterin reductase-like flavin-dependent oxidoreductase (luciferase family)